MIAIRFLRSKLQYTPNNLLNLSRSFRTNLSSSLFKYYSQQINNEKQIINNEKQIINNEKQSLNNEKQSVDNEKQSVDNKKQSIKYIMQQIELEYYNNIRKSEDHNITNKLAAFKVIAITFNISYSMLVAYFLYNLFELTTKYEIEQAIKYKKKFE